VQVQPDRAVRKQPPFDDRAGVGHVRAVSGVRLPVTAGANQELLGEHIPAVRADHLCGVVIDVSDTKIRRDDEAILR
jgi:hypothetical protein